MKIIVMIEERDGQATDHSLALLALARACGAAEVLAAVCGPNAADVARQAAHSGATRVFRCDSVGLRGPFAPPRVRFLEELVRKYHVDAVFFARSVLASEVAGGLASRLEAGVIWDLVDVKWDGDCLVGEKLVLGDSRLVECRWTTAVLVAVFRPIPLRAPGHYAAVAIDEIEWKESEYPAMRLLGREPRSTAGDVLETVDVVVAGGLGIGRKDTLTLLEELAGVIGGVVAVTEPVVDRGWYPRAHQVGLTGRTVRPRLYIACGISGAIQHRVGMQYSETIIAINTDPDAPIFQFCDLGVIADLHEVVPELTRLLRDERRKVDMEYPPSPTSDGL